MSDSILAHVKNIEVAAHIWKKLEDLYAQKTSLLGLWRIVRVIRATTLTNNSTTVGSC